MAILTYMGNSGATLLNLLPRIANIHPASLHNPDIPRHHNQAMGRGGGGDERIHYRQLESRPLRLSLNASPTERRFQINVKNPTGKPLDKIKRDP
jgi:hypothetical protein